MSKEISVEDELKLAERLGARTAVDKSILIGKDMVIYLSGDETPLTIEDLRALRDVARERRG